MLCNFLRLIDMPYITRTRTEMVERCMALMEMGFEIVHEDSSVFIGDMEFDFSATDIKPEAIIKTVMSKSYQAGMKRGEKEIQEGMKKLLNISWQILMNVYNVHQWLRRNILIRSFTKSFDCCLEWS